MEVHILSTAGIGDPFPILVSIVRDWRAQGRITTTAGVKPAFVSATGGLTEKDFSYDSWREFVAAAAEAGHVRLEKLATGHTGILLADEPDTSLTSDDRRTTPGTTTGPRGRAEPTAQVRLRSDVWMAFVEWHDEHRRLWDSRASRAFTYPVDERGVAAWESEPERFTSIEPISSEVQKEWMRDWASSLPPRDGTPLTAALAPDAPLGAFRRELDARGLASAWRDELQKRVTEHVHQWTSAHGVAWLDVIDRRARRPHGGTPKGTPRPAEPRTPPASAPRDASGSEVEQLRALVHHVVEQMPLAELAAIPIRAEYLLGRR
jgi:hypothetical protein